MKLKKFFKENYSKSWRYLKDSRRFIYFGILIFFLFSVLGFFVQLPEVFVEKILVILQQLLEQTEGLSRNGLIKFIFVNNFQSGFLAILLGVVLGVFPVISAAANGFLLGFVVEMSIKEAGILILWRLLPHGIFELPAIFICFGLGIKFGTFIFEKKKLETFKDYFWNSLRVFVFIVIPLLVVAAVIEGWFISLGG